MNHPAASDRTLNPIIVPDAVCTACGCICDDIELHVQAERIAEARNACDRGSASLVGDHARDQVACLVDGRPASVEDGIDRAARILAEARYPLVFGLGESTSEAQRAAVSLGDRVGACIDVPSGGESTIALQAVGEVTCTLGEIKNRGDLIVVWGADPLESHPRLFSRYALDPKGTFLPDGRSDRYCVIVDVRETESVREAADQFIAIQQGRNFEALWVLRALARGIELDADEVEAATGAPLGTWQALMERMKAAKYGVLFYGAGPATARTGQSMAHAVHALTRDMNALTRFVCMPLDEGRNGTGARNVLTWQTGNPFAVSLARGYPRCGPGEFNAGQLLSRGEADAALIVSGGAITGLSDRAREHLSTIPSIVLDSAGAVTGFHPAVVFQTAVFGVHTAGTVYRMDGVPLPLRAALASSLPSPEQVLRAIEERVRGGALSLTSSGKAEQCP